VSKASGLSRGDKSRNARLEGLRDLVPVANAIVGIDLADAKQMVVVTDHDSRVLARRTFRCRAWDLGDALDWAFDRAARAGFGGSRWRASRPGTGGGCWASSPPSEPWRSCACSR
jgi:transposase